MSEQEGHSLRELFAQQPSCQASQVTRLHLLHGTALCELRKSGDYPVAKPEGTPSWIQVEMPGGIRSQKLNSHSRQLLPPPRRVEVRVSGDQAGRFLGEFSEHGKLVGVGRGHRGAADNFMPAHPCSHLRAVEGLPETHRGRFTPVGLRL